MMKTVQMTIDEHLLTQVDTVVRNLNTTRSAFMRDALQLALKQLRVAMLERQHVAGYQKHPVKQDEFDIWEAEQFWEPTV